MDIDMVGMGPSMKITQGPDIGGPHMGREKDILMNPMVVEVEEGMSVPMEVIVVLVGMGLVVAWEGMEVVGDMVDMVAIYLTNMVMLIHMEEVVADMGTMIVAIVEKLMARQADLEAV